MFLNINKLYSYLSFIIISFIIALVVANRDLSIVADSLNYANNFFYKDSLDFRYEYLFDILTFLVRLFTDNYLIYFFILNFILNFFIFKSLNLISKSFDFNRVYFLIFSFCVFILSSWYYVASSNGVRQGLALALAYYSLFYYVFHENKLKSFIFFIMSCFFHYSNFLLIPFLIFLKIKLNYLFFIVNLFGLFYFLGVNEVLVKSLSVTLGSPLYDSIKYYAEDGNYSYRYGFQGDLFIYTLGFIYLYFFISKKVFKDNFLFEKIVKIYYICTLPYFFFGFAAFSNRYGLIAWFFGIFINCLIVYFLFKRGGKEFFKLGLVSTFFLALLFFYYRYF
ncbi:MULTISPECIES: EpsG family protein [unclassified Acinetobacter]|uniref:EpsG family protein n=1 Tax=unclassified Acinetobacter TaxID=196816 RepID=UPI0015D3D55B|nr:MULTISPECIES: EpsG family protein [unclassified Acinetobacter]